MRTISNVIWSAAVLWCSAVAAQMQDTKIADKCYQENDFRCAATEYSKLADKEKIAKIRAQYLNLSGLSYKAAGKTAEAEKQFLNSVKFNPAYGQAYENLALLYRSTGQAEKGLQLLQKAVQNNAGNADLLLARARYHAALQKNDFAAQDFKDAISMAPESMLYRVAYAGFKKDNGKYAEALADYQTMLNENPDASVYAGRGDVYFLQKKYKEALADVNKALTLDPTFGYAYVLKAKMMFQQKKMQDGCALLATAKKYGVDRLLLADFLEKCPVKLP